MESLRFVGIKRYLADMFYERRPGLDDSVLLLHPNFLLIFICHTLAPVQVQTVKVQQCVKDLHWPAIFSCAWYPLYLCVTGYLLNKCPYRRGCDPDIHRHVHVHWIARVINLDHEWTIQNERSWANKARMIAKFLSLMTRDIKMLSIFAMRIEEQAVMGHCDIYHHPGNRTKRFSSLPGV